MADRPYADKVFRWHWLAWRILGEAAPPQRCGFLYRVYSVLLHSWITVGMFMYLLTALWFSRHTPDVLFKTLGLNFTMLSCCLKTLVIWWKMASVRKITTIVAGLDERLSTPEEFEYYGRVVLAAVRRIFRIFAGICLSIAVTLEATALIAGLMTGQWRLLYGGYLPFDVYASGWHFAAGHLFEFVGINMQILQNVQNDTLGAMLMCLLAGHVHMLGMRVARIGQAAGNKNSNSKPHNNRELRQCIDDFQQLLILRDTVENITSLCMFFQLLISGANVCIVIIYTLFYESDPMAIVFNAIYTFGLGMELFPCCYYGSVYESEIDQLPYALFSSGWLEQNREFRQNLGIFMEHALKRRYTMAGGMFRINLDTFFATCKMAYSLFAVVGQMR